MGRVKITTARSVTLVARLQVLKKMLLIIDAKDEIEDKEVTENTKDVKVCMKASDRIGG